MRTAWRIALRSPLLVVGLAVWAVVAAWMGVIKGVTLNWRQVLGGFDSMADQILPATCVLISFWVFGPDAQDSIRRDRRSTGLDERRWTAQRLLVACTLALAWCLLAGGASLALSRLGPALTVTALAPWPASIGLILLRGLLVTAWAAALIHAVRIGPAIGLAVAAVGVALALVYLPDNPVLDLVRVLLPTAALRALHAAPSIYYPYGTRVLQLCLLSGAVWTVVALNALFSRPALREPRTTTTATRGDRRRSLRGWIAIPLAAGCLAAGAVIPGLATATVPMNARPFLLLERFAGTSPQQRAEDFLLSLRTNSSRADRLSVDGSARRTLGDSVWAFASLPSGATVLLDRVDDKGHAQVRVNGSQMGLCMVKNEKGWLVSGVSEQEDCYR
ncbi:MULTISPECIES: hypothetical protein [Acidipropionibacterium]|uniref:Uncharacterized protein n=1 Tax=Acidipropionibacterium jensenii TaxID=1749 RepID=A0A3Q9UGU8_9ACTN|nr:MULTISPECIES: hypothetical protein [Acidipropionibacterium]AZZ39902.1 hypothetical protein C0Z10_09200 [Acidipropionibacterium jensenii]AZZ41691.1 hypothetical protein C0Z11_04705 [Acidipropionibacterium jensenii]MDN5976227.1 hypothetical protein [Acidipropionibacterium jensenii]MDN5995497.1 hypothetical protein [Acidipropionibacterium jensenii]MDN6020878.1 hypothetical protein [Acidipropionibacterium jensenii]